MRQQVLLFARIVAKLVLAACPVAFVCDHASCTCSRQAVDIVARFVAFCVERWLDGRTAWSCWVCDWLRGRSFGMRRAVLHQLMHVRYAAAAYCRHFEASKSRDVQGRMDRRQRAGEGTSRTERHCTGCPSISGAAHRNCFAQLTLSSTPCRARLIYMKNLFVTCGHPVVNNISELGHSRCRVAYLSGPG